jgi:hypothetical protein
MGEWHNVAFNGNGRIVVVVGLERKFMVIEVGRNEANPGQLNFKRK